MTDPVVLYTDDVAGTRDEVVERGGRVLLVLTHRVVVAELPPGAAVGSATATAPDDLDATSRDLVAAWTAARAKTRPGPADPVPWDSPGFAPP